MFNWTTTTLINKLPHIASEKKGAALRIGKHLFEKRWVESIRKAAGHDYELCEAKLDLSKIAFGEADKVARLFIYVGLDGSEESIYANDWYRKGMPLSVSFVVDTPEKMAKAIVDTVKTFNVFTKVKKVLEVSAEGGVLVIKGTHEHQRLQKIQVLVDAGLGEEKALVNYELNRSEDAAVDKEDVKVGKNGFGTFHQLSKDLRLPTAVYNHWLSVQKDEMPIVGALYTQYIITYYAPSTANPSFTAVGNRSMSETTHVFWVKSDLVDAWEAAIAAIDPDAAGFNTIAGKVEGNFANKAESLVERVENLEKE
jgi:hypothetical protein